MPIENDDTRFDVRVLQYHIRRGTLTEEEVKAHLAKLPDDGDNAVQTTVVFTAAGTPASIDDGSDEPGH